MPAAALLELLVVGAGCALKLRDDLAGAVARGLTDCALSPGLWATRPGRELMEEQIPGGVQSPATWPDYPSMLRCSPEHHPASDSVQRVGVPFDFSSQLFEGRAVVRVRGVSSSDDDAYFRDRNRKMQCLVQGRFKKRIRCRDVVCGQEYSKPLELPLQLVVQPVLSAVQYMQPSIQVDLYSKRPYLLTPLAATAQALSVERSGQESNRGFVASSRGAQADMAVVEDPVEDTALLGDGATSFHSPLTL